MTSEAMSGEERLPHPIALGAGGNASSGTSSLPARRQRPLPALDPALARYRSRLEEQMASRRDSGRTGDVPSLPGPKAVAGGWRVPLRRWIGPSAASLAAMAAMAWWLSPERASRDVGAITAPATATTAGKAAGPVEDPVKARQALQQERANVEKLSRELSSVWRELEGQTAASAASAARDEELRALRDALGKSETAMAASAEAATRERERADKLDLSLGAVRNELTTQVKAAATEKARQDQEIDESRRSAATAAQALALERDTSARRAEALETVRRELAALIAKASTEKAAQEKQLAELRQALQRAEAAASSARKELEQEQNRQLLERATAMPAPSVPPPGLAVEQVKPVPVAGDALPAISVRSAAPISDSELTRLMLLASRLLGQGDIGGARAVLERAAETGSASAQFALAETFDPLMLSSWGTFGTQGDVARARELYAKALAGGVDQAGVRLGGLRQR